MPELSSFTNVAQTSAAADSASFSLEANVSVPGIDKQLAFSAEGAFDTPAKRSQMSVDLSSVAELMKSFGSSLGGTVTGDLGSPEDWKLEVIQDGDIAYVHFPLLAKQLPDGKTWLKGDAKTLSSADAGQLKQFGSLAGTDPRDVFGLLKAVSGSIEAVGTDEIRGVETSHYKATIDIAKLEQLVPAAQRDSLGEPRTGRPAGRARRDPARDLDRRRAAGPQAVDRRRREAAGHRRTSTEGIARRRALRLRQGARARAAAGRSGRRCGDAEAHAVGTTASSVTLEA